MNAILDDFTGQPDPGLTADAALEARIDAEYERMTRAPSDAESREHYDLMCRLIWQRSRTQQIKLELERRMRAR